MSERTKIIHIDIDPAEIGKNVKVDIPIVGDMNNVLKKLTEEIGDYKIPEDWDVQVKDLKAHYQSKISTFDGFVEPRTLIGKLSSMLKAKAILCADVGQNQIWCANNFRIREGRFFTTGGMGTMGYSIPAAIGAKLGLKKRDVVVVCGDGSFQMSLNELSTIKQYGLNIKIIVMRNYRLGMVRELQDMHYDKRHSATILNEEPDIVALAKAYGIDSVEVSSNEDAEKYIGKIVENDQPFVLVCRVHPDTPSIL